MDVCKIFTAAGTVHSSAWANFGQFLFCFHGGAGPQREKKKQCEDGWSQQAMFRGLLPHFHLLSDLLKIYPPFLRQDRAPMLKWLSDSDTLTPVRR